MASMHTAEPVVPPRQNSDTVNGAMRATPGAVVPPPRAAPVAAARSFSTRAASALSSLRFLASAFPAGSEAPDMPQFDAAPAQRAHRAPRVTRRTRPPRGPRVQQQSSAPQKSSSDDSDSITSTSVTATFILKLALATAFLAGVWVASAFGVLPTWDTVWPILACWVPVEVLWAIYFRVFVVPSLARFRPEDAGKPLVQADVDAVIDNIVFRIRRDPAAFWASSSGVAIEELQTRKVPIATARSFVRSLFMVYPEFRTKYENDPQQKAMLDGALDRLEAASGGFDHDYHGDADGGADEFEASNGGDNWDSGGGDLTSLSHPTMLPVPNLLRGWYDDEHLMAIVRSPPLLVILGAGVGIWFLFVLMFAFGWRRAYVDPVTSLECWVWHDGKPPATHPMHPKPLVLMPGAGAGFASFLPLAAQVQFGGAAVARGRVVLYRLPWAELFRLRYKFPQWSVLMRSMVDSLHAAGVHGSFDMVAHSYGTVVTNRFLRHLGEIHARAAQKDGAVAEAPVVREDEQKEPTGDDCSYLRVDFLALLDPIVLGSATTGIIGQINHAGPDLSFGFCCNRAGVATKEVLNFDPQALGQCRAGLAIYVSQDDTLIDIPLARHILRKHTQYDGRCTPIAETYSCANANPVMVPQLDPAAAPACGVEFVVDNTPKSFHGRWLVEMWGMGHLWGSPCATQLVDLLNPRLGLAKARAMTKLRAAMRLKTQAKLHKAKAM